MVTSWLTTIGEGVVNQSSKLIDVTNTVDTTQPFDVQTDFPIQRTGSGWFRVVWSTLQWIVFVIGTAGNLLVVVVLVWRRSRYYVVTQLFVGSLSMAGLALMLSSGWVQALVFMKDDFPFGTVACKVQYFWQAESIYCHGWNLVAVAIDRYKGISNPAKESCMCVKWAVTIVTAIWILTSCSNLPLLFWSNVTFDKSTGSRHCLVVGVDPTARAIQITIVRIADYLVPLVITWACYIGLIYKMKTALKKVSPDVIKPNNNSKNHQTGTPASRRVTIMCMVIAVCFTLTSLPLQINFFVVAFASTSVAAVANNLAMYFRLVTMLNACTNPFIYGLMWRPFRASMIKVCS